MTPESNAPTALSARLAFIAERLRIHGAARFSASLTRLAAEAAADDVAADALALLSGFLSRVTRGIVR